MQRIFKRVLQSQILRSASLITVSNWITTAISLAQSIILVRILGAENYGLLILAITLVTTVIQFMDIRTNEGLIKFMGEAIKKEKIQEAVTFFHVGLLSDIVIMIATFVISYLTTPLFADFQEGKEVLKSIVYIYILSIPFTTIQNTFQAVLIVFKKFKLFAAANVVSSLLMLILVTGFATLGMPNVMWGYVTTAILTFILWFLLGIYVWTQHLPTTKGRHYWQVWRRFYPFAFHTSLSSSLKAIVGNADLLLIGAIRPPAEVSYYKISYSLTSIVNTFLAPLRTVFFPSLNEAWAENNKERVKKLVRNFASLSILTTAISSLFIIIASPFIMVAVYGSEFAHAVPVARVLAIAMIFSNGVLWIRPLVFSAERPDIMSKIMILIVLLRITMGVPLIYLYGASGAGISFTVTMFIISLISVIYVLPTLDLFSFKKLQNRYALFK